VVNTFGEGNGGSIMTEEKQNQAKAVMVLPDIGFTQEEIEPLVLGQKRRQAKALLRLPNIGFTHEEIEALKPQFRNILVESLAGRKSAGPNIVEEIVEELIELAIEVVEL
jgi:hypothetical protein